jgi:hypothetical protein
MKQLYLMPLLLFVISCVSNVENTIVINPQDFSDDKFTLSEMAHDIKYVPLDNTVPIGIINAIKITDTNIYLRLKDIGIVKYDKNGKFLQKIGNIGRGPSEYQYGLDFTVDQRNSRIYVADPGKIKIYTTGGTFLRDISIKEYLGNKTPTGIELFKSLLFIPNFLTFGEFKFNWIFIDTIGNLVSKKFNSITEIKNNHVPSGRSYRFENELFYYNYLNDTIFSISPDLKEKAAYLFAKGNFRWNKDFILNSFNDMYDLFMPNNMFETKHFIFLEYRYREKWAILLIDKMTGENYTEYKNEQGMPGIKLKTRALIDNDLDGGLPLLTRPIYSFYEEDGSEYIISLLNPLDINNHVKKDDFKSFLPKFPEKKKLFENMSKSLKATDNPILMMVELKE